MRIPMRVFALLVSLLSCIALLSGCSSYAGRVGAGKGDTIGFVFVDLARAVPGENYVPVSYDTGGAGTTGAQRRLATVKPSVLDVSSKDHYKSVILSNFPKGYLLVEIPEDRLDLNVAPTGNGGDPSFDATIDLSAVAEEFHADVVYAFVLDPEILASVANRNVSSEGETVARHDNPFLPVPKVQLSREGRSRSSEATIYAHDDDPINALTLSNEAFTYMQIGRLDKYAIRCIVFGWNTQMPERTFRDELLVHTTGFHLFSGPKEVQEHFALLAETSAEAFLKQFGSALGRYRK